MVGSTLVIFELGDLLLTRINYTFVTKRLPNRRGETQLSELLHRVSSAWSQKLEFVGIFFYLCLLQPFRRRTIVASVKPGLINFP